jgi:hypothetical protein
MQFVQFCKEFLLAAGSEQGQIDQLTFRPDGLRLYVPALTSRSDFSSKRRNGGKKCIISTTARNTRPSEEFYVNTRTLGHSSDPPRSISPRKHGI